MPRIGIDARLTAYRTGGIAEYMRALIRELALLDSESRYLILHTRRAAETLTPASNFCRVTTWTPCHHRLERPALGVETARLRLDLLHSPDFIPPLRLPIVGARRTVITIHDLNFLYYPQFQTPDSLRYYAGHIQTAVKQADHILADSEATKADICTLLNVPPDRITVHLLGINPDFRPLPTDEIHESRAHLQLPESYILFVGTFEPRKNLVGLLTAYAGLLARYPDAPPLLIAGKRGWLYESIFGQVKALGLTHRVIWRENIADADRVPLYNGASVLVLPSFYEGFGLPPLEAMACGIPVVVSDRSSLPEVVSNVGIYIDPDRPDSIADGLYRALTDSAWRTQAIRTGIERAATFTWRRTAEIALRVYDRVLKS
ncbi:MAG: glycosyltransferase family 4 protein [Aggregatilineales bacterium]